MVKTIKINFCETDYYGDYQGFSFVLGKNEYDYPELCKEGFWDTYSYCPAACKQRKKLFLYRNYEIKRGAAQPTQRLINAFEKKMGFALSKVKYIGDGRLLIDVNPRWTKTGPMFHFLCLLIRNGYKHEKQRSWLRDLNRLQNREDQFRTAHNVMIQLVNDKGKLKDNYSNGGICDYAYYMKHGGSDED